MPVITAEIAQINDFFNKIADFNLAPIEKFLGSISGIDLSDVFQRKQRLKLEEYTNLFLALADELRLMQTKDKTAFKEWVGDDANKVKLVDVAHNNLLLFKNMLTSFLQKRPAKERLSGLLASVEKKDLLKCVFMLKGIIRWGC